MKLKKREGGRLLKFWRSFIITLMICMSAAILFFGIVVADNNTRMVSKGDDRPAVSVEKENYDYYFDIFGYQASISFGFLQYTDEVVDAVTPYIPPQIRLIAAGIINFVSEFRD